MMQKTVLVIDDNELNLKLMKSLLQLGGYQTLEATSAEAGIDCVRKQKPDLILMDVQLPGMDGLQATQIIRNDFGLKELPIVALSGYAMKEDEIKAVEAGCDGFMAKPIDTRGFLKTISQFITSEPGR